MVQLRAIFADTTNSCILRVMVRSEPTSAFFTYCWVIVEPPPADSLPNTLSRAARSEPGDGEAGVGVEVPVLRGEHRVADVLGDLVECRRRCGCPRGGTTLLITVVPSEATMVAT